MSRQPTVLIIEDAAAVREALHEALRICGYSVITAATVHEAEEVRERLHPEDIGLVLADIHLSRSAAGQEGYDLFQRWTEACPALPFVLMSADVSNLALPDVRAGTVRFLAKPFDLDELLAVVRALLGETAATTGRP